jgi:hypothetical protein
MISHHELKVFADYHQFYLWDAGVNPSAPEDYSDEDVRLMVKVAPNVVVVQPVRNMEVPVELRLYEREPPLDESGFDHVVECSVDLPTGRLQLHECTGGPVLDLVVKPGHYQVRALFSGLGSLSEDGLDGEDLYALVVWPAPPKPLRVLKQWQSSRA